MCGATRPWIFRRHVELMAGLCLGCCAGTDHPLRRLRLSPDQRGGVERAPSDDNDITPLAKHLPCSFSTVAYQSVRSLRASFSATAMAREQDRAPYSPFRQ